MHFIKTDAQLCHLNVMIKHERHQLERASVSFQLLRFSDKKTSCGAAGLNWHLPPSGFFPDGGFQVSDKWDRLIEMHAATASGCHFSSSSAAVRVWKGAEVVGGIKNFQISYSEVLAKCCFPRPPLPRGSSPLKPEKPEYLQQCERWGRVGTGTWRSAASHQCRLTDGSIQPAGPRHLNASSKTPNACT